MSAITPKPTQRERLVSAMIDLCARDGYQSVSVAEVSSRAGVSSATFYEQFDGKEDCLLAAFGAARVRVLGQIEPRASRESWSDSARESLTRLFAGLQADPAAARLLFVEALAGGDRVREERERALAEQEQRVEDFLHSRPEGAQTLDIPVVALEGARRYIVSRYLRAHSEDLLSSRIEDILAWMSCYAVPAGKELWSIGPGALLPPAHEADHSTAGAVEGLPARLPRGRHGLPPSVVARSQRNRIVAGTAEVMAAKGYANATVADIVAAAGVSRDVFYEHFADKQSAFIEAQQFATQAILNTCATAYFSASEWPLRVWRALAEVLRLIAEHPAIAHLRLVESYAAGDTGIRSIEEFVRAATIFLEEGFNLRPENRKLPRLLNQAISGAVLEVIGRHVARGENVELRRHLPQLTYIAIVPFVGVEQAIEAVTRASAEST